MRSGIVHIIILLLLVTASLIYLVFDLNKSVNSHKLSRQDSPDVKNSYLADHVIYPKLEQISEKKNLPFEVENHYRDPIEIKFDSWETSTYNETRFKYWKDRYNVQDTVRYDINLRDSRFGGYLYSGIEINFGETGYEIVNNSFLGDELKQSVGLYPKTIYHNEYQIIQNKHGIKMKVTYGNFSSFKSHEFSKRVEFDGYKFYSGVIGVYSENPPYDKNIVTDAKRLQDFDKFINTISY